MHACPPRGRAGHCTACTRCRCRPWGCIRSPSSCSTKGRTRALDGAPSWHKHHRQAPAKVLVCRAGTAGGRKERHIKLLIGLGIVRPGPPAVTVAIRC
jgi:hypothetical protein